MTLGVPQTGFVSLVFQRVVENPKYLHHLLPKHVLTLYFPGSFPSFLISSSLTHFAAFYSLSCAPTPDVFKAQTSASNSSFDSFL